MRVLLCLWMTERFWAVLSVQLLGRVRQFVTPWSTARHASLSITISSSLLRLMPTESVMPSNHLILCCLLLLLPSIFPTIRVFSSESVLHIRWPKYWSFSFSVRPSNEHSELISFRIDWFDLAEQLITGYKLLWSCHGFSEDTPCALLPPSDICVYQHFIVEVQ